MGALVFSTRRSPLGLQRLPVAAVLAAASFLRVAQASSTSTDVNQLSTGEIVAVVVGSIVGTILLLALGIGCWCWCSRRRRARFNDWAAKEVDDMEAFGAAGGPHERMPGGPKGAAGGGDSGAEGGRRSGRSGRASGRLPKDKDLQVSRSARVDMSAEVEIPSAYCAAPPPDKAHGPPLSKSSMLLRWLAGVEAPKEVAQQLAAQGAGKGGQYADNVPLLSLAAQAGIVFSKMPPSVASSPAVSITEGSMSRHLLKGINKRSETAPNDPSMEDGDMYPASLARASVGQMAAAMASGGGGSGSGSGAAAARQQQGIVFEPMGSARRDGAQASGGGGGRPEAGVAPGVSLGRVSTGARGARAAVGDLLSFADHAPAWEALPGGPAAAAGPGVQQQQQPAAARMPMLYETAPEQLATLREGDEAEEAAAAVQAGAALPVSRSAYVGGLPDGSSGGGGGLVDVTGLPPMLMPTDSVHTASSKTGSGGGTQQSNGTNSSSVADGISLPQMPVIAAGGGVSGQTLLSAFAVRDVVGGTAAPANTPDGAYAPRQGQH